ncbi:MAG: hypothetical protein VXZ38_11610 [Planctomycetota bacterium]|nr:hypothetical protein [Planctomycetota bacterium]
MLDRIKQDFIQLLGSIGITVMGCIGASTAKAGYSVLGGAPVTQVQMLISDKDYNALPAPNEAAGAKFSLQETRVESHVSGGLAGLLALFLSDSSIQKRFSGFRNWGLFSTKLTVFHDLGESRQRSSHCVLRARILNSARHRV